MSHNSQDVELDFFMFFLGQAINGDAKYLDLVNPIISDAISLVNQKKEIFELDRIGLSIKIYLSENGSDLFLSKTDKDVNNDLLKKISELVNNKNLVIA